MKARTGVLHVRGLLLVGLMLFTFGCTQAGGGANSPAPSLDNPTAAAQALVKRFFDLAHDKDVPGLQGFLSPAFQMVQADGSEAAKADHLTNLPTVNTYEITNLTASQDGTVLVARYLATVEGLVNGKPYTPGPAPRLSVFVWNGSAWLLAAHSNFNPLGG